MLCFLTHLLDRIVKPRDFLLSKIPIFCKLPKAVIIFNHAFPEKNISRAINSLVLLRKRRRKKKVGVDATRRKKDSSSGLHLVHSWLSQQRRDTFSQPGKSSFPRNFIVGFGCQVKSWALADWQGFLRWGVWNVPILKMMPYCR